MTRTLSQPNYGATGRRSAGTPSADAGSGMSTRTWAARIALAVLIGLAGQFVSGCGENPETPAGARHGPGRRNLHVF